MNSETKYETKFSCKTCPAKFNTLQLCLSHELTHISLIETKKKSKTNNNNRRKRKKPKSTKIKFADSDLEKNELQNTVISLLRECPEGAELTYLCRIFQPIPEDISLTYQCIYVDLNEDLESTGYQWEIIPFGSTIMAMAFKGSDIDFYVYPWQQDNTNSDDIFKEVVKILRHSRKFSNIITIPKARVPIVKCTHNMTGYNLDINVSSVLGVHGSQFIAKLLNLDSRVHPFMLVLKIWGKCRNLTGTGRITNYCLTLMAITYLQNCEPAILPSVKELQSNVQENLIRGINFAFDENYVNKNAKMNKKNIKEIIQGFFEFYSKLDFSKYIISPFTGKMIDREEFTSRKYLFPEYDRLMDYLKINYPPTNIKRELHCEPIKTEKLLVIQDPFCLNHNNAASVGKNIFDSFKIHLHHASQICTEFSSSLLTDERRPSSELLIRLFFEEPSSYTMSKPASIPVLVTTTTATPPSIQSSSPSSSRSATKLLPPVRNGVANSSTSNNNFMIFNISPIEAELLYVRAYLRKAFPQRSFTKIDINKFWIEKIIEYTREIITNIFRIEIIDIDDESMLNSKVSRLNEQQTNVHNNNNENNDNDNDDNDNDYMKYTMNCELKATVDTWSSRKNEFKRGYMSFLNEQLDITKQYDKIRKEENFPGNLHCKLTIKPENKYSNLTLKFEDLFPKFIPTRKSNLKIFFTQYTLRMRYFYRAYFEKLATFKK